MIHDKEIQGKVLNFLEIQELYKNMDNLKGQSERESKRATHLVDLVWYSVEHKAFKKGQEGNSQKKKINSEKNITKKNQRTSFCLPAKTGSAAERSLQSCRANWSAAAQSSPGTRPPSTGRRPRSTRTSRSVSSSHSRGPAPRRTTVPNNGNRRGPTSVRAAPRRSRDHSWSLETEKQEYKIRSKCGK